ncbi:histidine phosphatase family protein [Bdellovibrio bacteriovorus]|uniref:histidine phosphatase family protein n=1 Tax=Bdellovibrio bacteriovorus TaxID=959 RepID=UPI0035A6F0ED
MINIVLVRHGETDANVKGLVCGQLETQLTRRGTEQANALRELLIQQNIKPTHIFCSPLQRAIDTCKIAIQNDKIELVDALKETHTGSYSALTFDELHKKDARYSHQGLHSDLNYPDGESIQDLYFRMKKWIETVLLSLPLEPNSDILIFGHGGTVNCFLHYFLQIPLRHYPSFMIDNCSLTKIQYCPEKCISTIKYVNKTSP